MRQKPARFLTPDNGLKVGAVVAICIALIVVATDLILVVGGSRLLLALVSGGIVTWAALVTPLLLVGGYYVGNRLPPQAALWVVYVAVTIERFQETLLANGAVNLRIDEIVCPAITVGVLVAQWRTGKLQELARRVTGLLPLALFLLSNLIPTALMQDRGRGFSLLAILVAGALTYIGVVSLSAKIRTADQISDPLLIIGAAETLFGLGALALSVILAQPHLFGVQVDPATQALEPYGTMFEGNFFGQFTAAILLVAAAVLLRVIGEGHLRSRRAVGLLLVTIVSAIGLLASLTRGAWIGLVIGGVVVALLWWQRGRGLAPEGKARASWRRGRAGLVSAGAALVVVVAVLALFFALGGANSSIAHRMANILDFTGGSGYGRLRVLQQVLSDWHNPILGMGDGSFDLRLVSLNGVYQLPWIYSMFLGVLHDAGIVGLALFFWLLAVIYEGLWRAIRYGATPAIQTLAVGVTAALTSLLIAAQATTSLYLMFFWVFLGLAGAMPLLANKAVVLAPVWKPWAALADTRESMALRAAAVLAEPAVETASGERSPAPPDFGGPEQPGRDRYLRWLKRAMIWESDSAFVRYVVFLIPLVQMAVILWVIAAHTGSVPYADEWRLAPLVQHTDSGTLSLADLWAFHNEHRPLMQRAIDLVLIELTNWNRQIMMAFDLLVGVGTFALVLSCVRGAFKESRMWLALVVPVSLLLLSFGQEENWFWPWQLGFIGVSFGAALCLRGLFSSTREAVTWKGFALAILGALFSTLSSAGGLMVWVAFLPSVWKLGYRRLAIWIAAGTVTWAVYLNGLQPGFTNRPSLFTQAQYVLAYLGAPVGAYIPVVSELLGALGLAILATNVIVFYRLNRTVAPITEWISLALFSIGVAAITDYGRSALGVSEALSFRYQGFSAFLWVAALVTGTLVVRQVVQHYSLSRSSVTSWLRQPRNVQRNVRAIVLANVLLLMLALGGSVAMNYRGLHWGIEWSDNQLVNEDCMLTYQTAPDSCLDIYQARAFSDIFNQSAAYMQERHLAIFGER